MPKGEREKYYFIQSCDVIEVQSFRSARLPWDEIAAKFLVFAPLAINFASNVDAIRTKNV